MTSRRRERDHSREHRRSAGTNRRRRELHLFIEGEATEKSYIDRINRLVKERRFHLNVHGHGKPHEIVKAALELRIDELRRPEDRCDPSRDPQTWCLFDRDEHGRIDSLIPKAVKNGIRVAFSHPCFELWLLLHFQQLATPLGGRCGDLEDKLRRHDGFQAFRKHVGKAEWAALQGRFDDARTRALQLIGQCPSGGCGPEDHASHCVPTRRDPSTDVWKLLDSLGLRY